MTNFDRWRNISTWKRLGKRRLDLENGGWTRKVEVRLGKWRLDSENGGWTRRAEVGLGERRLDSESGGWTQKTEVGLGEWRLDSESGGWTRRAEVGDFCWVMLPCSWDSDGWGHFTGEFFPKSGSHFLDALRPKLTFKKRKEEEEKKRRMVKDTWEKLRIFQMEFFIGRTLKAWKIMITVGKKRRIGRKYSLRSPLSWSMYQSGDSRWDWSDCWGNTSVAPLKKPVEDFLIWTKSPTIFRKEIWFFSLNEWTHRTSNTGDRGIRPVWLGNVQSIPHQGSDVLIRVAPPFDFPVQLQHFHDGFNAFLHEIGLKTNKNHEAVNQQIILPVRKMDSNCIQSINQSINQWVNHSLKQSINHSLKQSIDHSLNQSIEQSMDQSIDGWNRMNFLPWPLQSVGHSPKFPPQWPPTMSSVGQTPSCDSLEIRCTIYWPYRRVAYQSWSHLQKRWYAGRNRRVWDETKCNSWHAACSSGASPPWSAAYSPTQSRFSRLLWRPVGFYTWCHARGRLYCRRLRWLRMSWFRLHPRWLAASGQWADRGVELRVYAAHRFSPEVSSGKEKRYNSTKKEKKIFLSRKIPINQSINRTINQPIILSINK